MANDDGLFLLEVLVDKVVFVKTPCFPDKDFRTCINIEASSVQPLEICDDEPGSMAVRSGSPFIKNFNIGKSCLFSLKGSEIQSAMSKFPVKVSVYKTLPCGCLPTKIALGEATIDMTKEFVQARKSYLENPTSISYQTLKDSFQIEGPEGGDAGKVLMFLRITCFGKLIVTQFQGTGPPTIGGPGNANSFVDRSCNPQRDFQTPNAPCVCGAAKAAAKGGKKANVTHDPNCPAGAPPSHGMCPSARDPYNISPCQDPDDPCFCCGAKPGKHDPMACRNTDKYCLHVPKGQPLRETVLQDEAGEETLNSPSSSSVSINTEEHLSRSQIYSSATSSKFMLNSSNFFLPDTEIVLPPSIIPVETTVYMTHTLLDQFIRFRHSGTQATASINKCLQVNIEEQTKKYRHHRPDSYNCSLLGSTCTMSAFPYNPNKVSEVYFFGKHKEAGNKKRAVKTEHPNVQIQARSESSTAGVQTKTGSTKSVSIKGDQAKKPCPNTGAFLEDVMVTVSHIRIAPREVCPVHGKEPCSGTKCTVANQSADYAPVKVSTMSNPRKGVFELVVRRLCGGPLAKNELMLEWTPPPSPAAKPVCPPSSCRVKCCKMPCKKPCRQSLSPPPPCRCCGAPPPCCKRKCKPSCSACPAPGCRRPCAQPCIQPCCKKVPCSSCCSSPCLRLCPVGRRRSRKCKSQPKIRAHHKLKSPCRNRSPTCPAVVSRSSASPCSLCCFSPCPPSKCCIPVPCKPIGRCKSCLTCC